MFNLYTYEKRMKNIDDQIKKKAESIKRRELYLKNRDKLANNFYKKMNNFLFEMIKTPIIINNSSYEPKEKAPIPFCFFKFKTERERIEKYLNKTPKKKVKRCQGTIINYFRQIDNNIDKREKYTNDSYSISNNMNNNFEYKNNIDEKIIQQSMKYKPRNDLERIMDSITKNKGSIEYKNMEDIRMK